MFRKTLLALVLTASGLVHAQIPISGLPNATTPLGANDKIVVNQLVSGTVYSTRQAPLSALAPFFPSINSHYVLQAADPLLPQSRTLTGTANQIIITDGGALGNLTLSLPQSICVTCGPTFSSLTLSGLLNGFSGVFSSTLQAASLSLTTPLQATSGGTGFGAYAVGDLLAASTTTALSKLSDVAAGSYLRSGGVSTLPLWSTLTLPNAATTGDVLIATGTNAIGSLADVTAGSYLRSNGAGAAPVYSTVKIPNTAVLGDLWYGSAANTVSALAGNTTSGVQFLAQTGTGIVSASPVWTTLPGSFTGFANPSGLIGLTAVNGVATTATRSDATHALDQSISPTMTGNWVFSPTTSATDFTVNNNSTAGSTTMRVASTFTSASTTPLLSLISTATTPFATFSLSANGTVGTDDFAIFQNGASNRDVTILNRAAGGALNLGAGGSNHLTIASTGVSTFNGGVTSNTVTGGFGGTVNYLASSAVPSVGWQTPSNGADQKDVQCYYNGGSLQFNCTFVNDIGSAEKAWLAVTRGTGTTVTAVSLGNATDKPPITLTGATSVLSQTGVPLTVGDGGGGVIANLGTTSGTNNLVVINAKGAGQPGIQVNASGVQASIFEFNNAGSTDSFGCPSGTTCLGTLTATGGLEVHINAVTTSSLTLNASGAVQVPRVSTTASAANAFLDNAAGNNLLRSTSSRRYKKDITDISDPLDIVMALRPVRFHSLASADDPKAWFYGLVAEEVATVEPSLIVRDDQGRPDGVQYDRVQVFMLPVVQSMHRQIQLLWACILLLVSWNAYLTFRRK